MTASGFLEAIFNKAFAGPSGSLLPYPADLLFILPADGLTYM